MKSFHSYVLRARGAAQQAARDAEARAIRAAACFDARIESEIAVTSDRPWVAPKRVASPTTPSEPHEPDAFVAYIARRLKF